MKNAKTTVSGLVAALAPWLRSVLPAELAPVVDGVATLAVLAMGWFAADRA